jgi:putative addiction module component (TIGR02574 family)
MSPDAKRVLEAALALPEDERIALAEALIENLEPSTDSPAEVEAAWTAEVARRLEDVETGTVKPIPWDEARRMIFGPPNSTPPR